MRELTQQDFLDMSVDCIYRQSNICDKCIHYDVCDSGIMHDCEETKKCKDFKDKSRYLYVEENSFTHICKSDNDLYPTEFTIYARIIKKDEESITLDRFQKFGALHCGEITISRKDFERYYKELKDNA